MRTSRPSGLASHFPLARNEGFSVQVSGVRNVKKMVSGVRCQDSIIEEFRN